MLRRRARITVVGSINQDIIVTVKRFPQPGETLLGNTVSYSLGGKGANQAVAAARAGAIVAFVGRTGGDSQSVSLRQAIRGFGVADYLLRTDEETTTGTAHITVDASGEKEIIVVPVANGRIRASDLPPEHPAAREANIIVTQGEIPVDAIAGIGLLGRELGVEVVLSLAPAIAVPRDVFDGLGVLVVNETKAASVLDEEPPPSVADALAAAGRLLALGTRRAVITPGGRGAVFAVAEPPNGESRAGHVPAPFVEEVVDSTGAGDAAVGVLAAALGSGMGFEECVGAVVRAGSLAVQYVGAASRYPEFSLTSGIQEDSAPPTAG
jgi:ribokinase